MQKVEGSNPFSRFRESLTFAGLFRERLTCAHAEKIEGRCESPELQ